MRKENRRRPTTDRQPESVPKLSAGRRPGGPFAFRYGQQRTDHGQGDDLLYHRTAAPHGIGHRARSRGPATLGMIEADSRAPKAPAQGDGTTRPAAGSMSSFGAPPANLRPWIGTAWNPRSGERPAPSRGQGDDRFQASTRWVSGEAGHPERATAGSQIDIAHGRLTIAAPHPRGSDLEARAGFAPGHTSSFFLGAEIGLAARDNDPGFAWPAPRITQRHPRQTDIIAMYRMIIGLEPVTVLGRRTVFGANAHYGHNRRSKLPNQTHANPHCPTPATFGRRPGRRRSRPNKPEPRGKIDLGRLRPSRTVKAER